MLINIPDFPPYYLPGENGQYKGIATEILQECLVSMHIPFNFVTLPIERMQVSMQDGLIDLHSYSYKKERESFVEYGKEEIFRTEYRPFVRADSSISIRSLADFDGHKLGHINGLRYGPEFMNYIEHRKTKNTLDSATNTEQNILKLVTNRVDIFVNAVEPTQGSAHGPQVKN